MKHCVGRVEHAHVYRKRKPHALRDHAELLELSEYSVQHGDPRDARVIEAGLESVVRSLNPFDPEFAGGGGNFNVCHSGSR